jgi:EmrB/QacA subfamily drug resistance transporter
MIQRVQRQSAERAHYRVTLVVIIMGVGAYSLAQSMVSPILPTIQRDLHTTQAMVTWLLTGYLLSAAVFTPILGRVGDMVGKDRVFVLVLAIFTGGSVICALAPNIGVMIAGRIVQGMGGAVLPLGFGIVRDEVPPEKLNSAIGLIAALLGVGGGLGTAVAGPIDDLLNYRWLFWIPGIVLAASAVAAFFVIPSTGVRSRTRINWVGTFLLTGWLVAILLGFSEAPTWGWGSPKVIGLLIAGVVLLVGWVKAEMRSANPLIDMKMLRIPVVFRVNLISLLYGAGLYGTFAFLPQFTQAPTSTHYGYGLSITQSGLILLPSSVATFAAGMLAGRLTHRIGAKNVVLLGSTLGIFPYLLLALPLHQVALLLLVSVFQGAGFGLAFSTMSNIIVAAVPAEQTGVANGMNANFRTIGGAIGAAVVSSLITAQLQSSGFPQPSSYRNGWILLAVLAAAAAVLTLTIPNQYNRLPQHMRVIEPEPVEPTQPKPTQPEPTHPEVTQADTALDGVA